MMSAQRSPDYGNPPVAETILGVQFGPLPNLRNGHLGAFWQRLGEKEWPTVDDAPPLEPQFERFDPAGSWQPFGIRIRVAEPTNRIQIKNATGDRMIQVQNGRLHLNWLRIDDRDYPRYEAVRHDFSTIFEAFQEFIAALGLGEIKPNQWEITYINPIPQGTVWRVPQDWSFFKLFANSPDLGEIAQLESFGAEWHFEIPPQRGRLHIQWQHGRRDDQETVNLTLTSRGPLGDGGLDLIGGLDLGRHVIVNAFKLLMSDSANRYWELRNADS